MGVRGEVRREEEGGRGERCWRREKKKKDGLEERRGGEGDKRGGRWGLGAVMWSGGRRRRSRGWYGRRADGL